MSQNLIDVDYLIVGAGPAGASLGCFLGKYGAHKLERYGRVLLVHQLNISTGFKGLIISSAPSTADTPRAHIINQPAMGTGMISLAFIFMVDQK